MKRPETEIGLYRHTDPDLISITEVFKNKNFLFNVTIGEFGYSFSDPKTGIEIMPQDIMVEVNLPEPAEEEKRRSLSAVKEFLEELYLSLAVLPTEKRPKFITAVTYEQIGKVASTLGFYVSPFEPNQEHLDATEEDFEKSQAYKDGKPLNPVLVYLPTEQFIANMEKE